MTISLPPEIEGPLAEEARRQGTTAESLAVAALRKAFVIPEPPTEAQSLYEYLGDFIGCLSSKDGSLSENCGEQFTEGLLEKQRRGHL